MTRETKIGLLVGLAFIIVIGILLSDHINTNADPVRASLTQVYGNAEDSVNAPNARQRGNTDVLVPPQPVVPQNRIVTQGEASEPRQNPSTPIVIGPGTDPSRIQLPPRTPVVQDPPAGGEQNGFAQNNAQNGSEQNQVAVGPPNNPPADKALANLAHQNGEEIVNTGGGRDAVSKGPVVLKPQPQPAATAGGRQIVAEENDTVSKFASKYMGANTKANREAIIKANPTVGPDGSKVFAGRTYVIPGAAPVAQAPATPAPAAQPPAAPVAQQPKPPVAQPAPQPAPAAATYTMYTVQEGETLWKIASEHRGSGARYTEIEKLNQDVLKGSAQVRPNMRIKLPAKAVASND